MKDPQKKILNVNILESDANLILDALGDKPWKQVNNTINRIYAQIQEQTNPNQEVLDLEKAE